MRCARPLRVIVIVLVAQTSVCSLIGAQAGNPHADSLARGRAIFAATCRSCHTVSPPSQGGPPMSRIAQRYVQARGSKPAAMVRIAEWLLAPTLEKSLLPRDEVARFGVMPHQPLADAGRYAVAAYVVTLADSAPTTGRRRRPR
jgi:mono/diheme cytochrome c family protein